MIDNKWTETNRPAKLVRRDVRELKVGEFPGPTEQNLRMQGGEVSRLVVGDPIWAVFETWQIGLDKQRLGLGYFESSKAVNEYASSYPVGTKSRIGFARRLREFVRDFPGDVFTCLREVTGVGPHDDVDPRLYEALVGGGVVKAVSFETEDEVLSWLGDRHLDWMQKEFGESWAAVAHLEYCNHHFDDSSLVSLAARIFVARFVTDDLFVEGYLTKEFESIYGGTEREAALSLETRRKAGIAGGNTSRARRLENLEFVMQTIEKLGGHYPQISEERIVAQAFDWASEQLTSMPKSRETKLDYEATLRSEEPFKSRYESIFARGTA